MDKKRGVIIFIKNPELGKAKTRLAATVGDEKALEIYKELLNHTRSVCDQLDYDCFLYYDNHIEANDDWSIDHYNKHLQVSGNLGNKMRQAFVDGFDNDYDQLVIIGSDCAVLQKSHIDEAFEHLSSSKVVLGPSDDGGYYLLGMRKYYYHLFEDKPWSQENLLKETVKELEERKVRFSLLEELYDIDTEEDLLKWKASMAS